jgi:drug/metabolite transporter (DMT)-like permease
MLLAAVVGRILASLVANILQKRAMLRGARSVDLVGFTYMIAAILFLAVAVTGRGDAPQSAFWVTSISAAFLDAFGNILMVSALASLDLSVFGPLNAVKPPLTMVLAALIFGRTPGILGVGGVALIGVGALLLVPGEMNLRAVRTFFSARGVWLRIGALGCFALGAICLDEALHHGDWRHVLAIWATVALPVCVAARRLLGTKRWKNGAPMAWREGITLGFVGAVLQVLTVLVMVQVTAAYAVALFQLASIPQVALGGMLFGEAHVARRTAGCCLMICGACVVLGAP